MRSCIHCKVSGRVQGVFYRAATRRKALELGIDGWVRNRPDGSVEVFACGDAAAIARLRDWLWEGPPHASVQAVQCDTAEDPGDLEYFEVR